MFYNIEETIVWIESSKRFSQKRNLDNMYKLCEVFDNPQHNKKFIHIAGTNGKGSTVANLASIMQESGLVVGMYISPYVTVFNERIEINGKYISDDDVVRIANMIEAKKDEFMQRNIEYPSFFEFMTLMAFIYFNEHPEIDIIILEAGMGGSLDSTNIVSPIISVITNVALDHQKYLGNTLEEIALNKLGIVKENVPLFTIENDRLSHLFVDVTSKNNSLLYLVNKNNINNISVSFNQTIFDYLDMKNISLNLQGYHQVENAAIAIEVCRYLNEKLRFNITSKHIYQGLAKTFWPGRLEVISTKPLIILDGAHNPDGINRLVEYLKVIKKGKTLKVVFAVSADKEKNEMIELLDDIADEIVFTNFSYKRSDVASELMTLSNHQNKSLINTISEVYDNIINDHKNIIVCCGSLYFVSELRKIFTK